MAIAIAVWSLELAPGKRETILPVADIKITNVALGDTVVDRTGRSTVKMIYNPYSPDDEDGEDPDEQTTVLCSLTAGKFEHTTTDIILEKETPFTFTVGGKNTVYLSGNYIDQDPLGHPPFDESDIMSDDEGDPDDLASDVHMENDDMTDASRFEELDEEPAANLKRGREPDATGDSHDVGKKSKKLKADNGQAISADAGKEGATGTKQDKKDEKKSEKKGEEKDERTVEKKDEKDEKKGEKKKKKAEKKDEEKDETKVEKDEKRDEKGEKKGKKKEKLKALSEKVLPGGLKIEEYNIGDGPAAKKGSTVSVRYIGKLENRKVFDKNVMGKPFTFRLGQGEVIKGWDEGIVGMQVNGERKLTIPPSLAYGKKGTEGIPSNSTLFFEVKLLEIK